LTSYLGDAVVAIFGSEGHHSQDPVRAVKAAQALLKAVGTINQSWQGQGLPTFEVGVGIHTGDMILSDVSMRGEGELTAVGDEAKVAANIEKLSRHLKARLLVSRATATAVADTFAAQSRGMHPLPGRSAPMEIFEVAAE